MHRNCAALKGARLALLRKDELIAAVLADVAACGGLALVGGGGRSGEACAGEEQDSQELALLCVVEELAIYESWAPERCSIVPPRDGPLVGVTAAIVGSGW